MPTTSSPSSSTDPSSSTHRSTDTATGASAPSEEDGGPTLASMGRSAWYLLGILLALGAVGWLVSRVALVVVACILAVLIAATIEPLVERLEDRGVSRTVSALGLTVSWILVLLGVFALVGWRFVDQVPELADQLLQALERLRGQFPGLPIPRNGGIEEIFSSVAGTGDGEGGGSNAAVSGLRVLAEVLTGAALAVVLSFFLLRDGRSMWAWFLGLFSRRRRTRVDRMGHAAYGTIAQYVRGLTVVALADATLSAIGLFALGVPLAEALVVLTLFAAYIPTIGAFVVGGLAVATAFASGGTGLAITVGVLYTVIQQVDGNVLQPWVMGSRLPLHPAAVLIALTCGGLLAGVVGALLFVPLSAAVVAAFRAWREDRDGLHEDQTTIPAAGHTA